jgi:hypothetical protein
MKNLFKRFSQAKVSEFYSSLALWQVQRLPGRSDMPMHYAHPVMGKTFRAALQ